MRVLTVHASYAFQGGEDEVCEAERDLLRANGNHVVEYVQDNKIILGARPWTVGLRAIWSGSDYAQIRTLIRQEKIDLVAVHNFFPLISPSVYYAARAEGVAVVQTLHNYRLICPSANLMRDGMICHECVGKRVAVPGVKHACYRQSKVLTAGVAAMTSIHRFMGTWDQLVTRYIALTDFVRDRHIAGGFDPAKIVVKPNFTVDSKCGDGEGNCFVFAGRLSPEKGVSTLLRAWALAKLPCELRIIGTGPEELNLKAQAASIPNVRFLGQQPKSRVQYEMGQATAVVVPSIWHEPFGLTIIEAFAKGTPVLATDLGGMSSLVMPGRNGYLYERGNAEQLARLLMDQDSLRSMRRAARAEYEERFTPQHNYTMLKKIYHAAIQGDRPSAKYGHGRQSKMVEGESPYSFE